MLVREEFECPHCKYTWSPAEDGCSNPGCSDPGCSDPGCTHVEYELDPMAPSVPMDTEPMAPSVPMDIEPVAAPGERPVEVPLIESGSEASPNFAPRNDAGSRYWTQIDGRAKPQDLSVINDWMDQEYQPDE